MKIENWNDNKASHVLNHMAKDLPLRFGVSPDAIGIHAMKYAVKRLNELAEKNTYITRQKLTEPQDEFLGNLIDECDSLIKKYKNESKINKYEYAQVDDDLLTQVEYVIFCANTFIKSMRGEL